MFELEVKEKEIEETMIFLGCKKDLIIAYKEIVKKIIIQKLKNEL